MTQPSPSAAALQIELLENGRREVACEIRRVLLAASAQEAALLGIVNRPLRAAIDEIGAPGPRYIGARLVDGALAGWVGLERSADGLPDTSIVSLVVDPAWQRQGIARVLLQTAVRAIAPGALRVVTPALNQPALALYRGCGFAEVDRGRAGAIEVVLLRHPGGGGMP